MTSRGGPSHPAFTKPAPWVVAQRVKGRFAVSLARVPTDFEATFITIGRLACEEHYSVGRKTISRWLDLIGKFRLIELRRAHVRAQVTAARIGKARATLVRHLEAATFETLALVNPHVAALAADYLRTVRGGGWAVSMHPDGDWIVGIARKSAAELVAKAERHGFDVAAANLIVGGGSGVGSAG